MAFEDADHRHRVPAPPFVVADQGGPTRDVVEIDADQGAIAQALVGIEERAQQLAQGAGIERTFTEALVEVQVKT